MQKYPMIWALIGLGNPGREYEYTRHNIGFHVIDRLVHLLRGTMHYDKYLYAQIMVQEGEQRMIIAKPQCFMNNSGQSVHRILERFEIPSTRLLVISDTVSLPVAKLRLKSKGSGSSHNGIRSIQQSLGSGNFARLYVGVGSPLPQQNLISYVLGKWHISEDAEYQKAADVAAKILLRLPSTQMSVLQQEVN